MKLFDLLPKEKVFYELLERLSYFAHEGSMTMSHLFASEEPEVAITCHNQLAEVKHQAKLTHMKLLSSVCRSFITPFDREDLQELASSLYAISKLQLKLVSRFLGVQTPAQQAPIQREAFQRFADLIRHQSEAMTQLMSALIRNKHPHVIQEQASVIDELEDKGDEALGDFLVALYHSELETRDRLLYGDLVEMLEDVTDKYRDAAEVALRIILKHS